MREKYNLNACWLMFEKNVSERGGRKWRSTSEIPGYLQWSDSFEKGDSK